jgi:NitT/TauT family transport system ATP-binding protein
MRTLLELHHVAKAFKSEHHRHRFALQAIDLTVHAGEFLVMVGPSGCGKSTLLRIMSHLEDTFTGTRTYMEPVPPTEMSFVFQHFALLPWLTVYQNVAINLLATEPSADKLEQRSMKELERFGIQNVAHHYPRDLSGGMQQRVGLARALVKQPKVLFLDEPFSELDSFTAQELRHTLLTMWQEQRPTIIMVTHIAAEAVELAERIAVFTPAPGTIEHIVTNPLPRPRNRRSPEFFALEDKLMNLIKP